MTIHVARNLYIQFSGFWFSAFPDGGRSKLWLRFWRMMCLKCCHPFLHKCIYASFLIIFSICILSGKCIQFGNILYGLSTTNTFYLVSVRFICYTVCTIYYKNINFVGGFVRSICIFDGCFVQLCCIFTVLFTGF